MQTTLIDLYEPSAARGYRSAVSLHAHTWFSKEALGFLPRWMADTPILRTLFRRELQRYRIEHGCELDFERAFWRPPLMPLEVCESEADQIGRRFDLDPLVSLTDHDSIDGPLSLQGQAGWRKVPVSLEWTVPFRQTVFHLGVHNLPADDARTLARSMAACTARPREADLADLLSLLDAMPEVLVVLNHPHWNGDVNDSLAASEVAAFLDSHGRWIHALELNGYRRWAENDQVIALAHRRGFPLVAGGDRHGHAPNAMLNLSQASSFAEFVDEIRGDRRSHLVILPEYLDDSLREIDAVTDILAAHPGLRPECRDWSQRVFFAGQDGVVRTIAEAWQGGLPYWMRAFIRMLRIASAAPARPIVRFALAGGAARMF